MAGYSATGTAKKLGVVPGMTLVLVDATPGWILDALPPDVEVVHRTPGRGEPVGPGGVVVAFFRSAAAYDAGLDDVARMVWPATALWAAWPRRAGGHRSDLSDGVIRDAALACGLVDNKVAAIDDDWSGLRFVWRKDRRDRPPPARTSP